MDSPSIGAKKTRIAHRSTQTLKKSSEWLDLLYSISEV